MKNKIQWTTVDVNNEKTWPPLPYHGTAPIFECGDRRVYIKRRGRKEIETWYESPYSYPMRCEHGDEWGVIE